MSDETWSPQWAKHVVGTWTKRTVDLETGEIEPSIVRIVCNLCGATHRVECKTGNVKGWVNRFASVHYHADPLDPANVRKQAAEAKARRESSSSSSGVAPTGATGAGSRGEPSRGG